MKIPDLRKAVSELGGKTFYDRRVYAGLSPFFLINSVLVSNHAPTFENWASLGVINIGALSICFFSSKSQSAQFSAIRTFPP